MHLWISRDKSDTPWAWIMRVLESRVDRVCHQMVIFIIACAGGGLKALENEFLKWKIQFILNSRTEIRRSCKFVIFTMSVHSFILVLFMSFFPRFFTSIKYWAHVHRLQVILYCILNLHRKHKTLCCNEAMSHSRQASIYFSIFIFNVTLRCSTWLYLQHLCLRYHCEVSHKKFAL